MTIKNDDFPADCLSDFEAAFKAGRATAPVEVLNEPTAVPLVVVHNDQRVESLEKYLDLPTRTRAKVTFSEVESFTEYVKDFIRPETRLFADPNAHTVTAVIDYHGSRPAHCEHVAILALALSPEWRDWTGIDRKPQSQVAFAEFLEDHIAQVVEPAGAVILETAKHLEAKRSVSFKSGINLQNGAYQFVYDEAVEGRGRGEVQVPSALTLGLAPFDRGKPYKVAARLRYRLQEDKLTFTLVLERTREIIADAFDEVLDDIERATERKPLLGDLSR